VCRVYSKYERVCIVSLWAYTGRHTVSMRVLESGCKYTGVRSVQGVNVRESKCGGGKCEG